jgi:hypothetical protein
MDAPRLYGRPTGKCKRERKSPLRTKAILPPSTVQWKEFAAREEDGGLNFQQLMLRMVGGIVAVRMVLRERRVRPGWVQRCQLHKPKIVCWQFANRG